MKKRIIILPILALSIVGILLLPLVELTSTTELPLEIHVEMWHERNGELILYSHHPGVLTTIGKNWAEDYLDNATWIGLSNDTSTPQASWVTIPNEITTGGMGRALGTYADNGDGAWNVTAIYNPTEDGSCQLTGLYWGISGDLLFCADVFLQVNYQADTDTVTIKWSLALTGS